MASQRNSLLTFLGFIVISFIAGGLPYIHLPFTWIQTYFHELSHGLATVLTGGKVMSIELNLNGSGLCVSLGGIHFIIAFAGYFGAVLWGYAIYLLADHHKPKLNKILALAIIAAIVIPAILWVRDFISIIIIIAILSPFLVVYKLNIPKLKKFLFQFVGIYVLLDAIKSPLVLIGIGDRGDANSLAQITGIPGMIWIIIWFCFGLFMLFRLWKYHIQ